MPDTTNNRMELAAAIEGLKVLKRACQVTVLTDSDYVRRGITEFLPRRKSNGWQNSCGKRVVNQDLWEQLEELVGYHAVTWYTFEGTPANSITNAGMRWRHRPRGQPGGQPRLPDWKTKSDGDRKPVVWAVDTGKPVRRAAQPTGRLVGGCRRQKGDVQHRYI